MPEKYALLRKILNDRHGILSSDSSKSGAEDLLFSSGEESLRGKDYGGLSSPSCSSNTGSGSSAHFTSRAKKEKQKRRQKGRKHPCRLSKRLERTNHAGSDTDQSERAPTRGKKKDHWRRGTTAREAKKTRRKRETADAQWTSPPHRGNSRRWSPSPEPHADWKHADWKNPLESNFPFSSAFLGKDTPPQREPTSCGGDCWQTCLRGQPTANCILCAEDTQMGKLKKIIPSIFAIKPMCIGTT
ncbi:hypothetical protein PVBG_00797 [Plasmodium vivax Brazil I]|uniref:Uncharacterized protein n=1 Tax=Plasmodium vivax (strain Brazil I) TaxID=1033975 RepID=A0A0J9SNY2_PLAV1|nr:hypothetical protein PVBG_00797 [Plasmodium vivax Brazil I]